jgi:hypothetical protein
MIRALPLKALLMASVFLLSQFAIADISGEFSQRWNAADDARKEAASSGYEWRDTKKMLASAKTAMEKGNTKKAMKLVAKAHEQGRDALEQGKRESMAWKKRVPK